MHSFRQLQSQAIFSFRDRIIILSPRGFCRQLRTYSGFHGDHPFLTRRDRNAEWDRLSAL